MRCDCAFVTSYELRVRASLHKFDEFVSFECAVIVRL